MLTPLAVDASHPFPQLLIGATIYLCARENKRGGEPLHADRSGAARLAAAHLDAARQRRRRTVGLHLSRFAASSTTSAIFSRA